MTQSPKKYAKPSLQDQDGEQDADDLGGDILRMTSLFASLSPSLRKGLIKAIHNVTLLRMTGHGTIQLEVKGDRVLVTTTISELFKEPSR